ncbi:MAG: mechanosensitive ion channel [Clostridia bacterium]|nr:mechanosensitive ion channel [Clostridia bacterium]
MLEHSRIEPALKSFFHSIVKVGLWIIACIIIADKLGIETASFVAILSVAGLALSLSIQNILSNLFSGFTIMTTKPFAAGDFVELDSVSGVVSSVGLFYTNIKTIDNKLIYIPNGQITSAKIINYSSESQRRVDLYFEASYDDSTESVKSAIMQAINAQERILKDPEPFVGLLEYKDSSIRYILRVWVNSADYWDVYFALNETVREMFEKNGVSMTYAHLNVHMVEK